MIFPLRLFEKGLRSFRVVLGDANLKIDLPFGVQTHEILSVSVHEDYSPDDAFHHNDVGAVRLNSFAKMTDTVCLLCLPEAPKDFTGANCTVTGYGRPNLPGSSNGIGMLNKETKICDFGCCAPMF